MSEEPTHGTHTVRASKGGGGGGKLLLGAVAAAILLGGGYYAYSQMSPERTTNIDAAYNDQYSDDPLRAGPVESDEDVLAESASIDESDAPAPASSEPRRAPARRTITASADTVPEATIGITPISATTTTQEGDDIIVMAPRRPIWARTPTSRRLSELYPDQALQRGREGEASLHCTVLERGRLDCAPVSATPGGFGNAAVRVARTFRHAPTLADGSDATGTPVNLRVVFRLEDEDRRRG